MISTRFVAASRFLAGFLVCAAAVGDAATTLSGVQTLSPAGESAHVPAVDVDPDGNAVFAWRSYAGQACSGSGGSGASIQTRARSASGVLTARQTVAASATEGPAIGLAASGGALVTWAAAGAPGYPDLIKGIARAANGSLGPVTMLGHGAFPRVAVDATGNAVLSWGTYGGIQARARSASSVLTAAQVIVSTYGEQSISGEHEVGLDGNRNAVFVWAGDDVVGVSRISTRRRFANGTLGPVRLLSGAGGDATSPRLAVGADGNAVFVWQRWDGVYWRIQTRAQTADGVLTPVRTLSAPDQDAGAPAVAVDANGRAVFVWSRFDGTNWRVEARTRSAAGGLGAVQLLSPAGQDAGVPPLVPAHAHGVPHVAVDARGRAAFTWSRYDGANWRIQGRARSAGGVLGTVDTLSVAGQDARSPRVAIDSAGASVFVWSRCDGTSWRVQTRARS